MKDFFDWLSSNSVGSIVLIASFSILALSIVLIYLVSFFQGREISFYPPKIGQKPEKKGSKNTEQTKNATAGFALSDRAGLTIPLETRIANAKTVNLMAINLVGLISQYEGLIEDKTKEGCNFRILMVSPKFFDEFKTMITSWQGSPRRAQDLEQALAKIHHLLKNTKNIQVRVIKFPPPYSLLIIDGEREHGEVQVEMYTYKESQSSRPHFILTKAVDEKWYEFFRNEFELAWLKSEPLEFIK